MEGFHVLPHILTLDLEKETETEIFIRTSGKYRQRTENCLHAAAKTYFYVLVCGQAVAQCRLGATDALGDLLLMLHPVLQNLVHSASGPPQVQL